ncbi:protein AKNAD1 [Cuculus canorus]|uniref:protein AKNAD1 n=1 Tax=Cuculus canorus TaxID=55661 RepID=UPI0023AAABD2|nr:protein AKNAD1 [Cuculus canorus]
MSGAGGGWGWGRTDTGHHEFPCDGDAGITCKSNAKFSGCACTNILSGILNLTCSEDNENINTTANDGTRPEEFSSRHRDATETMGISVEMPGNEASLKKELPASGLSKIDSKEHLTKSKMSDVLLRHFSKGELSTCQLIECESIPETSLTESIDDTVDRPWPSEYIKGPVAHQQWANNFEEYHLEKHEGVSTGDKNKYLLNESWVSKKPVSSAGKCVYRQEHSPLINEDEDTHILQNMKEERHLYKKTVSPHELKYGQVQTHCYLPDFSKVASEVEVPKRTDSIKSVPTTERVESFPVSLRTSIIANNIPGNTNYFYSAETENQEETSIPELWQQLEMLTQQDGTQNHPDHPRLNPKMLPQSDFPNAVYSGGIGTSSEVFTLHVSIPKQSTHGLSKARLHCGTTGSALPAAGPVEASCLNHSNLLPELTVGEKMSQILKDQTAQLIKKVEDFSKHMTQETFLLQDNYLALNQLKSHLDALEKNYLTAREQHRYLQLQNYKDKSINVGEFDPERKVEGEIFRLGMLLEDIQEQSDDSKCNLSSLLTSYESAHSSPSPCERFLSPEEEYAAEGLASHSWGTLSQNFNADEESMKGNTNVHERKTATCSLFIQRKPTDLSDTNLSSNSEDTSAYNSYNDSLSEELVNCETESHRTFNTRLCGERRGLRCICPAESRDQFKLRNYKDTVRSCAQCRNKTSVSSSFQPKKISTRKPQRNKQPHELVNRLSERKNIEAAKTCYSSTYDKIVFSHKYLPSKKSARNKSAISIRNANDSNATILSSTLDHAIQTANSLKKATERMVRAVSEDLAKVKRKQL